MRSKILFEWFLWILISLFMFSVGMIFAPSAPLLILIAPLPFMVLAKRQGLREAALGAVFASVASLMFFGVVSALLFTMEFGLLGVLFGAIAIRSRRGVDFVLQAMTVSIAAKVVLMMAFTGLSGANPFAVRPETAAEVLSSMSAALSAGGIVLSEEILKNYAILVTETVSLLMPSMIIFFSAMDTLATYTFASYIIRRIGGKRMPSIPPLEEWRFPKNLFWALAVAVAADFASKAFPDERAYAVISANLMEVLRALFMVEGIALSWYYMAARGIAKPLRIAFAVVGTLFSPLSYILSLVGIFDIWYDLRARARRKK